MPARTPLGLALSKALLMTVRFKPLKAFDDILDNIARFPMQAGGPGAMAAILEADVLEGVGGELDCLSEEIFGTNATSAPHGWRPAAPGDAKIGPYGDLTSKIEDLLLGMARMVPLCRGQCGKRHTRKAQKPATRHHLPQ
jgi:magnesium transporter